MVDKTNMRTFKHIGMNRQIISLAIPNIISNLSIPLLGAVDAALMGRLESEQYLGAVAVGGVIFSFVYWGFGFLRMGTTGLTAQAYGAGDERECGLILSRGLLVAAVSSILLLLLQSPIAAINFSLIEASTGVETLAREYFQIRIYAAPATLCLYVFHGVFLGLQNAKYPMILTVVVNALNVGLNLLFVQVFQMKADGVALGTVISQYVGLLCAILLFRWRYAHVWRRPRRYEIAEAAALKRFLRTGFDIFIRTLCLVFANAFFTSKSGSLGDLTLAVNSILLQFVNILAYGIDGFAFAAESLTGKHKGASDMPRLRGAIKGVFLWSIAMAGVITIVFAAFGSELLRLFTDQPDLLGEAKHYLVWIVIAPLINVVAYVWDGVFLGVTASKPMRNAMIVSVVLFFLPAYYLLRPLGNHGLWLALTLFLVARGTSLSLLAPRYVFVSSMGGRNAAQTD